MNRRTLPLVLLLAAAVPAAPAGDDSAWQVAQRGRALRLPDDHVSHPDHKIEWWYYTGNLDTSDRRRFGYQLTFFRVGVDPRPENPSRWAINHLHMAHFAVSDLRAERFHFFDRLQREGAGWAGAATDRYHVWNGRWSASLQPDGSQRIRASAGEVAIDLELGATAKAAAPADGDRRWMAHGDNGFSQKGAAAGNASHYYSMTRLDTRGTLAVGGRSYAVSGLSWMDHEFGTSMLEDEQVGWDWFAIQLADGRDLMLYQMRRRDGTPDRHSSGTVVDPRRGAVRLEARDYVLEPVTLWRSPTSGHRYPIQWRVTVPGARLALDVRAAMPDQELHTPASTGVTYWEGAIDVTGTSDGRPVSGRGYMELTGYSGVPLSQSLR